MSSQWECLAFKKIGDDVSGSFPSNAGSNRFNGIADFADDMSDYNGDQAKFDANWIPNDSTKIRGNPSTDVIDWQLDQDDTDDNIRFDLWSHGIFPSDTNWTLRWKWTGTTQDFASPNNEIIMLRLTSDSAGLNNGVLGEYVGFAWSFNSLGGAMFIFADAENDAFPNDMQVAFDTLMNSFSPPWTRYFELKRTSATTVEATIYSDASYSVIVEKVRGSFVTSLTDFRYIQLTNEDTTPSTGVKGTGTIDEVTFFNNTEGTTDQIVLHAAEDESLSELGPFDFFDDFSTYASQPAADAAWPSTDTAQVRVNITNDNLDFLFNLNSTNLSISHDLGIDFVDKETWTLDGKINFSFLGADINTRMYLGLSDEDENFNIDNGIANRIFLFIRFSSGFKDFSSVDTFQSIEVAADNNVQFLFQTGVDYFWRVVRTSLIGYYVEVFTDSARTISLGRANGTCNPALGNLRYIIFQNIDAVDAATMAGTIDDVTFYNTAPGIGQVLDDDFSTYGTPVSADFTDVFNSATGWTTTDFTRVRIEDDQGFLFFMAVRDNSNDQIAFDLGSIVNPLGNVVFTDNFSYASQLIADASWPTTDVANLDPFPNEMSWLITGGVEDAIFHDLGVNLNGNFRIRAKIDLQNISAVSALGKGFYWGISDITGVRTVAQDFIGLAFFVDSDVADQKIRLQWTNAQIPGTNQVDIRTTTDVQIYYVEILRTSNTAITVNIYSDAGYTALTDTASAVMTAGVGNLRYLKAYAGSSAGGGNTMDGILDDIEVIDNSQELSDKWLLQFKLSFTDVVLVGGAPEYVFVGIGDLDQTAGTGDDGTAQDYLGAWFRSFTPSGQRIKSVWADDEFVDNLNTGNNISYDFDQGETLWVQIIRDVQDLTLRLYDDPLYSHLIEEVTVTFTGVTALRYLKVSNLKDAAGSAGTLDATVDDVSFWNGRTTSCDVVQQTPTFFDDFSTYTTQPEADLAWVPQVLNTRVDIVNDNLEFVMRRDGTDNRVTHDLGFIISDTAWVLRYTYHLNAGNILTTQNGANFQMLIQDTDVGQSSINDSISYGMQNTILPFGRQCQMLGVNGGSSTGFDDEPANAVAYSGLAVNLYMELVRNGDTIRGRRFSNPDFTGLVQELNGTMSAGVTGLRYLIASSGDDALAWNGTEEGYFDNVQFWNNQITPGTPWVSSDPDFLFVDPCQENLQAGIEQINSNSEVISLDLGNPLSDAKWVMRFSYFIGDFAQISGGDLNVFIGMSDNDSNSATSQDYILFRTDIDTVALFFAVHALSNSVPNGSVQATFSTTPTRGTIYLEIIRESATQCRITIFSDENYTFPIETEVVAISSALKNLRFVKVMTHVSTGILGNIWTTSVDDIKIWDGVDVADGFEARRYLQLLHKIIPNGANSALGRFNLDQAISGAFRDTFNAEADVTVTNRIFAMAFVGGPAGASVFTTPILMESEIYNKLEEEKLIISHQVGQNTLGASNLPDRTEIVTKWTNLITRLSRINWTNGQAGSFDTDTDMVIFGSD